MKKRLLCQNLPQPHRPSLLSEGEAHHAIRVLRLKHGDIVEVLDGKGSRGLASLQFRKGPPALEYVEPDSDQSQFQIKSEAKPLPLTLEMAILKGEAMEWVIEKAVELGVSQLVPVITDFTVVQIKNKGPESFRDRWQKIADQALKQCGRLDRLEVQLPISFHENLVPRSTSQILRIWCDESSYEKSPDLFSWINQELPSSSFQIHVLIGPEGGWSPSEREALLKETLNSKLTPVTLGPFILRAETAAIYSVGLVSAKLRSLAL